jgi:hypothetical protein
LEHKIPNEVLLTLLENGDKTILGMTIYYSKQKFAKLILINKINFSYNLKLLFTNKRNEEATAHFWDFVDFYFLQSKIGANSRERSYYLWSQQFT